MIPEWILWANESLAVQKQQTHDARIPPVQVVVDFAEEEYDHAVDGEHREHDRAESDAGKGLPEEVVALTFIDILIFKSRCIPLCAQYYRQLSDE